MNKIWIGMLAAALVAGFAGCAQPQEAGDGNGGGTPEFIRVGDRTYECDDTLDADGICDGYELNEGAAGEGDAQTVEAGSGGQIQVGGQTYACEDVDNVDVDVVDTTSTAGECERYERAD